MQFCTQLDTADIFQAFVVTMPVSLPECENDVIFSKRQACIQSEVGPRKSSYGFWGSAISSIAGSRAERTTAKIKHLKHFHDIGEPRFLQYGGSSQVIDQEFSKRGPSQGSGTKQNEENSEAKCEISVRVQFLTLSCTK